MKLIDIAEICDRSGNRRHLIEDDSGAPLDRRDG